MVDNKETAPPAAIETPCDGNCVIDPDTGYCEGCLRTITEISQWTRYSPEKRRAVMNLLPDRASGRTGPADE